MFLGQHMSNRYKIYSDDIITGLAKKAREIYLQGWSIDVAMNKAGFTSSWRYRSDVRNNKAVIDLIEYDLQAKIKRKKSRI